MHRFWLFIFMYESFIKKEEKKIPRNFEHLLKMFYPQAI